MNCHVFGNLLCNCFVCTRVVTFDVGDIHIILYLHLILINEYTKFTIN